MSQMRDYAVALLETLVTSKDVTSLTPSQRLAASNTKMHYLSELINHVLEVLVSKGYDRDALINALVVNVERWKG